MTYTDSTITQGLAPIGNRSCLMAILAANFLFVAPALASAQKPVEPFQRISASALSLRDSIVAVARAQLGRRYVHGGSTPKRGFDCSGLVTYVLSSLDIRVPRTASAQAKSGWSVARDTSVLQPGDLLLFGRARDGISHVGIYVGNGHYVHASSIAGRVIESPLNRPPSSLIKLLMTARRVLAFGDSVPVRFYGGSGAEASSGPMLIATRQRQ